MIPTNKVLTESFSNKPIKQKLGFNIDCVDMDTQPARSPVLVLFIVSHFAQPLPRHEHDTPYVAHFLEYAVMVSRTSKVF